MAIAYGARARTYGARAFTCACVRNTRYRHVRYKVRIFKAVYSNWCYICMGCYTLSDRLTWRAINKWAVTIKGALLFSVYGIYIILLSSCVQKMCKKQ